MRKPELDLLRFVAIAMVIGRHLFVCSPELNGAVSLLTNWWMNMGWAGVDLFFVLSGYLVGGLLVEEHSRAGKVNVLRFVIRRGFKIYPSYYLMLAATMGVAFYFYRRDFPNVPIEEYWAAMIRLMAPNLMFVQNYIPDTEIHLCWSLRMTWSLAVEEHFYFFLPVLMRLIGTRGLVPAAAVAVVCCFVARLQLMDLPYTTQTHLMPTHLRVDGLLVGAAVSLLRHRGSLDWIPARMNHRLLIIPGVACFVPWVFVPITTPWVTPFGNALNILGGVLLLLGVTGMQCGGWKPLLAIGRWSYSIYLWHAATAWFAGRFFNPLASFQSWLGWVSVYIGGAVLLGFISYKLVESPMLKVRDWFLSDK